MPLIGTGTCFYCTDHLFETLVYLDEGLPRPRCSGKGLALHSGRDNLPSLKEGVRGRILSGGAG